MRCKNCGSENEEGRYICQNCGSPLYDEDEEMLMNDDGYLDDDDYDEYQDKKNTKKYYYNYCACSNSDCNFIGNYFCCFSFRRY